MAAIKMYLAALAAAVPPTSAADADASRPARMHEFGVSPDCRQHPRDWTPPPSWRNASFCPRLHPIHCGVYDPSGTIAINGTYFVFPDGAPADTHWASTDLLRWSLRSQSWFDGLTGGISATPSGIYAHWVPNEDPGGNNPGHHPMRAVGVPGGAGLGALDRWACNATARCGRFPCCGAPVAGSATVLAGLHDAGRALQLEPGGPWFLVVGGPGSSWGRANPATIWLLQADDDTLASFRTGGAFFRLVESDGRVLNGVWSNASVPLGTLECAEVFRLGAEKFVVTAGVYRKTLTQTSEWFVGARVRNASASSGWSIALEKRGHVDYGAYYSAKVARDAYPATPGGGRHVVFGEVTPVGGPSAPPWMDVCGSHHAFPRDLALDERLGLRVKAIPELASLRAPGSHVGRSAAGDNGAPMALGSQAEISLTCRYKPSASDEQVSFGVDVLVSPDGSESLRVGFTDVPIPTASPGLRMFVDHSKCCNRAASRRLPVPGDARPRPPPGTAAAGCDTQSAPLPALSGGTNVTMRILVDGGLVEVYGMDAVALTAVAAPSPDAAAPEQRLVRTFAEGATASPCEVHGWKLSLKNDDAAPTSGLKADELQAPPARAWDVAIGRRPYISETEGHLLLRTPGLTGLPLCISASLCAGTLGNWSWNVTGGADQTLSLGPLAGLPHRINNDLVVTLAQVGGRNASSIRRRFQRALKADARNTVQVDHHTAGLLVDGAPWFGAGWYQYSYTSFVPPDCDPSKVPRGASGQQKNAECMRWGFGNLTKSMGAMAARGVNFMMPYSFSPFARHGLTRDLPGTRADATAYREKLVLAYFDEAARHGAKLLFDCAGLYIDQGDRAYTNETLEMIRESVALVKDHPALLGYYTCGEPKAPAGSSAHFVQSTPSARSSAVVIRLQMIAGATRKRRRFATRSSSSTRGTSPPARHSPRPASSPTRRSHETPRAVSTMLPSSLAWHRPVC
jgi:hypothetical protein